MKSWHIIVTVFFVVVVVVVAGIIANNNNNKSKSTTSAGSKPSEPTKAQASLEKVQSKVSPHLRVSSHDAASPVKDFAVGIYKVYKEEKAARYTKPSVSVLNPQTLNLKKCLESTKASIMPIANAEIVICETQVARGDYGAVFEGVLLCPDQTCSDRFEATPVNDSIKRELDTVKKILLPTSVDAVTNARWVRKVAVKFGREGHSISEMIEEIDNMQKLQCDLVVKYLGQISENPKFKGELMLYGKLQEQTLIGPGIVMEYLEGPTVLAKLSDMLANSDPQLLDQLNCYLAQMILMLGEELKRGLMHNDMHFNNVIVLEHEPDEFELNKSVTCKKIKMIDLGRVEQVNDFKAAVDAILYRAARGTKFQMNQNTYAEIHAEVVQLVIKLLADGASIAKTVFAAEREGFTSERSVYVHRFIDSVIAGLE